VQKVVQQISIPWGICGSHGKAGGFFSEKLWGDGCLKNLKKLPEN